MAEQPPFPQPESREPRDPAPAPNAAPQTNVEDEGSAAARELIAASTAYHAAHPAPMAPIVQAERQRRSSTRTGLLIGGGAALLLLLGLGGGAAWAMSAHGDYAYNHVASGASVYAQLNLEPSLMQKLQVSSFLSKLPRFSDEDVKGKVEDPKSVAEALVDQLASGSEVKDFSWAGSRYALVGYGDFTNFGSDGGKYAIVMQVSDQAKAIAALRGALRGSSSDVHVAALDNDYVLVGTSAGIRAATASGPNLADEVAFSGAYKQAGDPLSYWLKSDGQVSAGGVHADWSSAQVESVTTGQPLGVLAAAEAQNAALTGQNSISAALGNFGLAAPATQLDPDRPAGKQLLTSASLLLAGAGGTDGLKDQLRTLAAALGDNVSVSFNTEGGRVLLHGTTEAKVDAALSKLVGQPTSLRRYVEESGSNVAIDSNGQGVVLTYGGVRNQPVKLTHVGAGAIVGQVDLTRLPKSLFDEVDTSKLGSVSFSTSSTPDGSKLAASWDLP